MNEAEDAATTIARLLKNNLRVVKDNGALASINISSEWQNAAAFKMDDGQITVGLAECSDQKMELTGKIRRRLSVIRVNVWTTETPNADESAKTLRNKIVEEVNQILRRNSTKPNETTYTFVGLGAGGQGSGAFSGAEEASPNTDAWVELSDAEYQKLWYSDDDRYQLSSSESGKHAVLLLRFKVESRERTVKRLVLSFEGYGTSPLGDGITVKVWNHSAGVWENTQTNDAAEEETILLNVSAALPDYVDAEGYVWFLAETAKPTDGQTPATLECDTASCMVVVNGITYCDVVGYRNLDRVDIKPPVYRTEFTVKSWFIENIGA
ncbi:MAG: hypothetical protein NWE98_00395 [Candidatus Bathyarchaeota archaeon]|nr:hypothetical protein [Candidatus Bathyarchaeota archaeon]